MRGWPILLIVALAIGYVILGNIASAMALNEIASRPVLALARDGGTLRVPVQSPGQPARPDEARIIVGKGVPFGYAFGFGLPDSSTVTCTIRFRTLACDGGWTAERAAAG
jgi:hypothetical protein